MVTESEQVRALKLKYRGSLKDKAEIIEGFYQQLNDELKAGKSDDILNELFEFLHKLSGSTGMYGFDKLSRHCRKAMSLIQKNDIDVLIHKLKKIKKHLRKESKV